jgi:hypothetical protein
MKEHTFSMEPYPYRSFWSSLNPIPESPLPDIPAPEVLEPPTTIRPLVVMLPPDSIVSFDGGPPRPLMSRADLIGISFITVGIVAMAFVVVTFAR